jgi:hypothetical protein
MRYFILFLGLGFLVGGAMWVVSAFRFIATAKRSFKWPVTSGVITNSAAVLNDQSCLPMVEYRYEINGHTYVGNSIHIGAAYSSSKEWAMSVLNRYPIGGAVTVAVDPLHPSRSVLERGTRWHMYMYLCAGALITMLGCGLLYLGSIHWNDKSTQQGAQEGRAIESRVC